MKYPAFLGTFVVGVLIAFLILWGVLYLYFPQQLGGQLTTVDEPGKPHYLYTENGKTYAFDLADPANAPDDIRKDVELGYKVFMETQTYAAAYAGDAITCNNCHFVGGNTFGGVNGGISLLGASKTYPKFSSRDGRVISLEERINNCFRYSINGRPLPEGAPEMKGLIAYLDWISFQVRDIPRVPWLGLKRIAIQEHPDIQRGAALYKYHCAACHRLDGAGTKQAPPLWGEHSFNAAAGMGKLETMASFVFYNMPHMDPILKPDEAVDISAYVLQQYHPKDP